MITLLLLIVIHGTEPKFLVTKYGSLSECRQEMYAALDEFKGVVPAIRVIRAECIEVGKPA